MSETRHHAETSQQGRIEQYLSAIVHDYVSVIAAAALAPDLADLPSAAASAPPPSPTAAHAPDVDASPPRAAASAPANSVSVLLTQPCPSQLIFRKCAHGT